MFYIGCPMWGYKEWLGTFFPEKTPQSDFLRLYSRKLTTVEGNTTFYAIPSEANVARWAAETPEYFRFCPKIPRTISHEALLESTKNQVHFFLERMRGLGERLGPMFLQLPPAFGPAHLEQLEAFLSSWPDEVRLAVEVRHPDFYTEEQALILNDLLKKQHVARVVMDTRPIRVGTVEERQVLHARERKPDLPLQIAMTTDFTFVRYIGHPRMEVNEPLLDEWAKQLAAWLREGITAFVFCHCPYEVHSPEICYALYQRVRQLHTLPQLPWEREKETRNFEQGKLF